MATLMCETCGTRPATHRVVAVERLNGTTMRGVVAKCCVECGGVCAQRLDDLDRARESATVLLATVIEPLS